MVRLSSVIFPLKAIAERGEPCKSREREDTEKTTRITMVVDNFEIGNTRGAEQKSMLQLF